MPRDFSGEGANRSPQLSWSGAPAQTASYVLSCFDPDAPTPSGYWHWTVVDIPPSVTSLPLGAGADDATIQALTEGRAFHIRNDSGDFAYDGPFPPAGDREHRYVFAVHALKIPSLELDPDTATNATVHFMSLFNGLAPSDSAQKRAYQRFCKSAGGVARISVSNRSFMQIPSAGVSVLWGTQSTHLAKPRGQAIPPVPRVTQPTSPDNLGLAPVSPRFPAIRFPGRNLP